MPKSTFARSIFGLVVLSLIIPVAVPAQQQPPPSVVLEINANPQGQVGAIVRTLDPGPNVANVQEYFSGKLIVPWLLSLLNRRRPTMTAEPAYDSQEFPNGPKRVRLTFPPVPVPAARAATGVFTPGFVGFIVPVRLGRTLTPESFLKMFLSDYVIEVNGVKFMDSDLATPQHVTSGDVPQLALLLGSPMQFWGLNITQKITQPGTYVIRNYIRAPKTISLPELSAIFRGGVLPAGEVIIEMTINIQP